MATVNVGLLEFYWASKSGIGSYQPGQAIGLEITLRNGDPENPTNAKFLEGLEARFGSRLVEEIREAMSKETPAERLAVLRPPEP